MHTLLNTNGDVALRLRNYTIGPNYGYLFTTAPEGLNVLANRKA